MLSKPFNVASGSLSLSHTLPTFERSGDPSRSGGGETSYFPRRLFCTRKSGQSAWPCKPARVSTAAAADPSRFPSPSFREARQARGGRERQGWGEKGGELPACTLSSRPGPKSRLRVLLLPACERAEEVERRSLAGGRGLGGGGLSVRAAEAPAIGRPRSHGVGAGAEAGAGPAPARSLARARGPPRLHRHDTDTLSLQLLSEPGALGTRRRGQPEPRTPELARPPAPPAAPRAAAPACLGAGGGDRSPAPASGARLPAAAAAAARLPVPGARGSRRVSEAAAAEAGERSRRHRGRPPRFPARTALCSASAPVTFPGRLPRPRAPGPAPQAGARPSPALPYRGAAGGRRRPGGGGRRGRLQRPPASALCALPGRTAAPPPPRGSPGARSWGRGSGHLAGLGAGRPCPEGAKRRGAREVEPAPAAARRLSQRPLPGLRPRRTQAPAHAGRPQLRRVPGAGSSSRQQRRRERKTGLCSAPAARTFPVAFGGGGRPEVCACHRRLD